MMIRCLTTHDFEHDIYQRLVDHLLNAPVIDVGEWQATQGSVGAQTAELEDVSIAFLIPDVVEDLQNLVRPNLPWAEEHFGERVGGQPLNPPPSSARWPFAQRGHEQFVKDQKFSHTYPERLWPKQAEGGAWDQEGHPRPHAGLRFDYGDLEDVVQLLRDRPATRQAYIPIWFPEDGSASLQHERVPCTLGYHAMIRDHQLSIRYFMRSCDFMRHFRDDVYMAARLAQWLCQRVGNCTPGRLVMHMSSLHVFAPADIQILMHRRRTGK